MSEMGSECLSIELKRLAAYPWEFANKPIKDCTSRDYRKHSDSSSGFKQAKGPI
jgi:hypothetical protein